jgi:hypothetical protein
MESSCGPNLIRQAEVTIIDSGNDICHYRNPVFSVILDSGEEELFFARQASFTGQF